MKVNVGTVDKAVRLMLGLGLLSLLVLVDSNLRWIGLIGLVPLATALAGYCPLYTALGLNTCATDTKQA